MTPEQIEKRQAFIKAIAALPQRDFRNLPAGPEKLIAMLDRERLQFLHRFGFQWAKTR